ncbi:hypothetical protein BC835DRAFT_1415998 [Cytidiella melzeri]|nr:hypothetical protein BC835DRAFT_1415998 [Cytidiella melzeri]
MKPDAPARNSKPNWSNYVSQTKSLISKAIESYMIWIFTTDLFPGAMVAAEWATDDWSQFYAELHIILRGIKDNLFKNADNVGVCYRSAFDPIPVPLLIAGLTILQYGLDIWASVVENPKLSFSEDAYKKKYDNHMKQLKKWTNINPEGVKAVRAQQYKQILRLADISLPQEGVAAGLLEDALQRAQRDLAAQAKQGSDEESK